MYDYHCISGFLEEMRLREEAKKLLRRYNRLRLRSGMGMITLAQLEQKKNWKYEKQQRTWLNRKKDWGEELQRKRMMRIMVRWNRLRVRQNLPPLDCIQLQSAVEHAKARRKYLVNLHRQLRSL